MKHAANLTVFLAVILAHSMISPAQGESAITTSYARGRLARISNMNEYLKSDDTCQIRTHVGAIVALKYEDERTEPYAVVEQRYFLTCAERRNVPQRARYFSPGRAV